MHRLIIANTYYQLIMAIQMNYTVFNNDSVTLLLSDHSQNAKSISGNLNDLHVFTRTCYIETNGIISRRSRGDKIIDFWRISFLKSNRYTSYIKQLNDLFFDEIICFNYNIDIYGLYSTLYNYNENIVVSLYEEGVLSYGVRADINYRRNIIKMARHIFGKKDITDAFGSFYCFYPSLYYGPFETIRVPHIKVNGECIDILKKVFNVSKLEYQEKYIFFTSVYDFEGGESIGEFELVSEIGEVVGKNNLLIKIHPRDTRTIYIDNGFKVDNNSSVPWEVIQLSQDFSSKIYLTATSGSVLAGSLLTDKPPRTFYMHKLCNMENNSMAKKTAENIVMLLENNDINNVFKNISIVEKVSDILQ